MRDKYLKKWTRKDDFEDIDAIKDKQIKELRIKFNSLKKGLEQLFTKEELMSIYPLMVTAFIKCSRNNELD